MSVTYLTDTGLASADQWDTLTSCLENPLSWPIRLMHTKNRLLLKLDGDFRRRVIERAVRVPLARQQTEIEAGQPLRWVFFPETAVISIVGTFRDGSIIEMATVGREGCTGIAAYLQSTASLASWITQSEGDALRLDAAIFRDLTQEIEPLEALMRAYTRTFLYQILVAGACNGLHHVEQRLARWLLAMHDRTDDEELKLTQEFLSQILGVHRPTITVASRALQTSGIISYERGRVRILDRARLEQASCECYHLVRNAYETLLPGTYADADGADDQS